MFNYTHEHRLRTRNARANKGLKAFTNFWLTLEHIYKFCFVCGNLIPKMFDNTAIQPFGKKSDWVHKSCFDTFITFDDAKARLDEKSRLICHVEDGFSDSPTRVCRERVMNTEFTIVNHIDLFHPYIIVPFTKPIPNLRSMYFLKPTGKQFKRVIA